jgi:hypothetical protein
MAPGIGDADGVAVIIVEVVGDRVVGVGCRAGVADLADLLEDPVLVVCGFISFSLLMKRGPLGRNVTGNNEGGVSWTFAVIVASGYRQRSGTLA